MKQKGMGILFMTILIGFITAGVASAENSLKKDAMALSFGLNNGGIEISGRYFTADDIAALAGLGFSIGSNSENVSDLALTFGVRKYLSRGDLAPFAGVTVSYTTNDEIVQTSTGTDVDTTKTFSLNGNFGLEYFFTKQISAEGQVGLEFSSQKDSTDMTTVATFASALTANFYFP